MTPWTAARHSPLSFTTSLSLLKLISIVSMMPSNCLILCHPVLLQPSIFPSIRVFSNDSVLCIRWPKYWSFCFSVSPSNGHSGLISFRIDCFDLLAVQGTLKSLLHHHCSKASILRNLAFFMVHPVYDYWKNHSFACMVFVGFKLASFWSHPMHLLLAFFWNHFKSKLVYSVWILAKV